MSCAQFARLYMVATQGIEHGVMDGTAAVSARIKNIRCLETITACIEAHSLTISYIYISRFYI